MSTSLRLQVLFISLFIVILTGCPNSQKENSSKNTPLTSKEFQEKLKEGKPAYTNEEGQKYVEELIPLVEKYAGAKFHKKPTVKISGRKKVYSALWSDLLLLNSNKNISTFTMSQVGPKAKMSLGIYGMKDRIIYLLPRNVIPLLKLCNADLQYMKAIIKIVIAHELAHALQDQQVDLAEKIKHIKSIDAFQAFNCIIEGQAMFIQTRIAKELGYGKACVKLAQLISGQGIEFKDPYLSIHNKMARQQYYQTYITGQKFIAYHYKKGGNKLLWNILNNPPLVSKTILYPEQYGKSREKKLNLKPILVNLENEFGNNKWKILNTELGAIQFNTAYANLDNKIKDEIVKNIKQVQILMVTEDKFQLQPVKGNIAILIMTDKKHIELWNKSLIKQTEENVNNLKESPSIKHIHLNIIDYPDLKADFASVVNINFVMTNGLRTKQTYFRTGKGPIAVEIELSNLDLSNRKLTNIARKIFARYKKSFL